MADRQLMLKLRYINYIENECGNN